MGVSIEDRVDALERRVRVQRVWLVGCVALLVALPLLALGPASSLLRADRVEAREIVIVGADGTALLTLGGDDTGGTLELIDHAGDPAVVLGARGGSRRVVHVGDPGMRGWGVLGQVDAEQPINPLALVSPSVEPSDDDAATITDERLRPGVDASNAQRQAALALIERGWVYVMPRPKSRAARWGNTDTRTTWFNGYWINRAADSVSTVMPTPTDDYLGDGNEPEEWSPGGTPEAPTVIEWLCSRDGGIEPAGD